MGIIEPSVILHECTPGFPVELMEYWFEDLCDIRRCANILQVQRVSQLVSRWCCCKGEETILDVVGTSNKVSLTLDLARLGFSSACVETDQAEDPGLKTKIC